MKFHRYTFDAGKLSRDGKADWPDGVKVILTRRRALEMIGELSRQLENEEREEIEIFLPGKLEDLEK